MHKDIGSILRLHPLGEHGLIVTWCTANHGIIRTAARGARKPGSDYTGRLDLFHECELLFTPARSGDLHTLGSVTLLSPRLGLRQNLSKLRLASYMARLLLATVEPGGPLTAQGTSTLAAYPAAYPAAYLAAAPSPSQVPTSMPEEAAWHHLLAAALDYLEQCPTPPRAAVLHRFERRLAELHGLYSPLLPPWQALTNHFHHLPSGRTELLNALA